MRHPRKSFAQRRLTGRRRGEGGGSTGLHNGRRRRRTGRRLLLRASGRQHKIKLAGARRRAGSLAWRGWRHGGSSRRRDGWLRSRRWRGDDVLLRARQRALSVRIDGSRGGGRGTSGGRRLGWVGRGRGLRHDGESMMMMMMVMVVMVVLLRDSRKRRGRRGSQARGLRRRAGI